jgi:hypothetical protein
MKVVEDNQAAIELAKNPKFHRRTKHVAVRWHFCPDHQSLGTRAIQYVPTEAQMADGLTKALHSPKFDVFFTALGLHAH